MDDRRTRAGTVHRETAREAGFGPISLVSVVAGLVTAYGTFAVIAALVGAALGAADLETEFRSDDWTGSGAGAIVASAVSLLVAYLFGGYVAGRMARRSGVLHGVAVFVASLLVGGVAGGVVAALTDDADIRSNLRSIGVPTTWDQVGEVAVAGVVVSLVAILVGSVLGGILGERWHTKLASRAADPEVGPAAEARARAVALDDERARRLERDQVVAREQRGDRSAPEVVDLRERDAPDGPMHDQRVRSGARRPPDPMAPGDGR